jgi:hypothetical protein
MHYVALDNHARTRSTSKISLRRLVITRSRRVRLEMILVLIAFTPQSCKKQAVCLSCLLTSQ